MPSNGYSLYCTFYFLKNMPPSTLYLLRMLAKPLSFSWLHSSTLRNIFLLPSPFMSNEVLFGMHEHLIIYDVLKATYERPYFFSSLLWSLFKYVRMYDIIPPSCTSLYLKLSAGSRWLMMPPVSLKCYTIFRMI